MLWGGGGSAEPNQIKINISKDSEQTVEQNVTQTIHVTAQGQCSQSVCLNVYLKNEDGSAATDIDAVNLLTSDQLTDKNTQKTIDETLKDSVTLNNGTKASPTAEWKNDKDDNGTVTSKYLQITMPADATAINFDRKQDQILTEYNEEMENLSEAEIAEAKEKALQYNESLANTVVISDPFDPDAADDMSADYISALNLEKNGIMAYVEIPRIDVYEPVYHGTSEEVLAKGVGHLEGTSLPIGGESTHTVLSGHTGLPEAEIFTKLESVKEGDIFLIHVLNETLAYKVDQIKVVEPSETDDLKIVPGYDYATLVTCTPYGINSHRLLVRGIRTEYTRDVSDEAAGQAEEGPDGGGWKAMYEKAIIEGVLLAVILVVLINVIVRKSGKKNKSEAAIYDKKDKKEKKSCKKVGKRRRRKSKRTEHGW